MTIRIRDCVEGILDDALEVFNIVGIGLKIYENRFLTMNENNRIGIFTNCCSKEGDKKQIDYLSDLSIDYFHIVEVECVILVPCMFGESGPFFRGLYTSFLCSWILVFRGRFVVPM